jgi:predicted RNase H-like HicB family nuclease
MSPDGDNVMAEFTAIFEKGEEYFIGYCPEVPGANG